MVKISGRLLVATAVLFPIPAAAQLVGSVELIELTVAQTHGP